MSPPEPEPPREPDIFDDTRQMFHDLRGRLSLIFNALHNVGADAHGLSSAQAAEVARIDALTQALDHALLGMSNRLLDTLAFTPASRLIWITRCLHPAKIDTALLGGRLAEIRATYPRHAFTEVIVVAEPTLLPRLRAAFTRLGCAVRVATSPSDVGFLLDESPCELIAMRPPDDEEGHWWKLLRVLLQGAHNQPILMHLAPPDGTSAQP